MINSISDIKTEEASIYLSPSALDFTWLNNLSLVHIAEEVKNSVFNITISLKNTSLSFKTSSGPAHLDNRFVFIKAVVLDVVGNCPKNKPLTIISLGASELLMEYLFAKALFQYGFKDLHFVLVDPEYTFCSSKKKLEMERMCADFNHLIGKEYEKICKQKMSNDRIHYLARAQNISDYPLKDSNILLIESVPYEFINCLKKDNIPGREPHEYFIGSKIVPVDHANTIAFLPNVGIDLYKKIGIDLSQLTCIPYIAISKDNSSPKHSLDWGCKILSNGQFFVKFFGADGFCSAIAIPRTKKIKISNEKDINFSDWFSYIQQSIEETLQKEISLIQDGNKKKMLTQTEKSLLLKKVKEVFDKIFLGSTAYYLADYHTDRAEMLEYLKTQGGKNYRKGFALTADAENPFLITEISL